MKKGMEILSYIQLGRHMFDTNKESTINLTLVLSFDRGIQQLFHLLQDVLQHPS